MGLKKLEKQHIDYEMQQTEIFKTQNNESFYQKTMFCNALMRLQRSCFQKRRERGKSVQSNVIWELASSLSIFAHSLELLLLNNNPKKETETYESLAVAELWPNFQRSRSFNNFFMMLMTYLSLYWPIGCSVP